MKTVNHGLPTLPELNKHTFCRAVFGVWTLLCASSVAAPLELIRSSYKDYLFTEEVDQKVKVFREQSGERTEVLSDLPTNVKFGVNPRKLHAYICSHEGIRVVSVKKNKYSIDQLFAYPQMKECNAIEYSLMNKKAYALINEGKSLVSFSYRKKRFRSEYEFTEKDHELFGNIEWMDVANNGERVYFVSRKDERLFFIELFLPKKRLEKKKEFRSPGKLIGMDMYKSAFMLMGEDTFIGFDPRNKKVTEHNYPDHLKGKVVSVVSDVGDAVFLLENKEGQPEIQKNSWQGLIKSQTFPK